MKRLLLTLICCSPLLFSPSVSNSITLTGPSSEPVLSVEQYGPVSPVDTLWGIASRLRPDRSVSVQQTMVALYKTNPSAFRNADINKIISNSILDVPSLAFVQQQTNSEAIALINRFAPKKINVTKVIPVEPTPKVVEKVVELKEPVVIEIDDEITEKKLSDEQVAASDEKLKALQAEIDFLNEQFIVATEASQALKLKIQPLNDQISLLSEQIDSEITVQEELQKIIDDYRAQLDAIEPAPFSGEGIINEIFRFITSSMANLLIVIFTPALLLLLIFIAISRIRTKRLLAEQEQEIAESTAVLMEESGQFDELLTDDVDESSDEDSDFDIVEEEQEEAAENIDLDELDASDDVETIDLTDDASDEIIDLTEDASVTDIDLDEINLDDMDTETTDDDPFGIGALTDDIELMPEVDLDEVEPETSEDDPFGIGALTEDLELSTSENDEENELAKTDDDPFGIGALEESDDEELISTEKQADLDLAAEWEAQVAADANAVEEENVDDELFESNQPEQNIDELLQGKAQDEVVGENVSSEVGLDDLDDLIADNGQDLEKDISAEVEADELDDLIADNAVEKDISAEVEADELDDLIADNAAAVENEISAEVEADELDDLIADNAAAVENEISAEVGTDELDDLIADNAAAVENEISTDVEADELDDLIADNAVAVENEIPVDADELDDLIADNAVDVQNEISAEVGTDELDDLIANNTVEIEEEATVSTEAEVDELPDVGEFTLDSSEIELDQLEEALTSPKEEENLIDLELEDEELDALNIDELTSELLSETEEIQNIESDDSDNIELPNIDGESDLLAKQISDVAFNEEVELPTVTSTEDDFIDIETLLESSGSADSDEPYTELDLDLGLDEFPDVVELQENVDIDDDQNGVAAQLDLARAYLEIDDKEAAKDILMSVVEDSDGKQRIEIDKLLSRLK